MTAISDFYPGDEALQVAAVVVATALLVSAASLLIGLLICRRSTTRHALLASALVCCLAAPLLAVAMHRAGLSTLHWNLPVAEPVAPVYVMATQFDPPIAAALRSRPADHMPVMAPPAASMPIMAPPPIDQAILVDEDPSAWAPSSAYAAGSAAPLIAAPPATAPLYREPSPPLAHAAPAPARPVQKPSAWRGWLTLLTIVWLGVTAVLLARLAIGGVRLFRLRRRCRPWQGESLAAVLGEVRQALQTENLPPILTCDEIASPFVTGLFQPAVILPAGLDGKLSSEELRDVLIHECAHALRRDPVVRYLQAIAGSLYWPLPTIHLVNHQLGQAREEICDNYVIVRRRRPNMPKRC